MEYGVNISYFTRAADLAVVAKSMSQAGIRAADFSPVWHLDNWEEAFLSDISTLEKNGMHVHQVHSPISRYGTYEDTIRKYITERTARAVELAGAKYLIVHGDEFDFNNMEYSEEAAFEYNYELYAPVVEQAARKGFKVAFETVFEDTYKGRPRFCSRAHELMGLIKRFNTDTVCCCWDFGHAHMAYGEAMPEKILEFGSYIECTHVHDSCHGVDAHLPPYMGVINWEKCSDAMKKIGYKGNLTFEFAYGAIHEDLLPGFARYLADTAELLTK